MKIPIYQVDAFTDRLFGGNPAAVCPLTSWLPDATLQAIAAENNLAETAFYVATDGQYHLRWFTPTIEVDLCGHATVATAAVILTIRREVDTSRIVFTTRSGQVAVDASSGERPLYTLDFPSRPAKQIQPDAQLVAALHADPKEFWGMDRHAMCVFKSESQVRALNPDMALLTQSHYNRLIVTAPGDDCDFVSRFFAPQAGIPEDPVTGSAHTTLIPYWAARLSKPALFARQISARGGELWCQDHGSRVAIGGHAVPYLEGFIQGPG